MRELLRRADDQGALRGGIDRRVLADRICQSMLHVGIGVYHRTRGAEKVPALKCRMLTEGLAATPPSDTELDRSAARRAADEVIAGWNRRRTDESRSGGVHPRRRPAPSSAVAATRPRPSGTSRRPPGSARGPSTASSSPRRSSSARSSARTSPASPTAGRGSALEGVAAREDRRPPVARHQHPRWLQRGAQDPVGVPPVRTAEDPNLGLSFPSQLRHTKALLADASAPASCVEVALGRHAGPRSSPDLDPGGDHPRARDAGSVAVRPARPCAWAASAP